MQRLSETKHRPACLQWPQAEEGSPKQIKDIEKEIVSHSEEEREDKTEQNKTQMRMINFLRIKGNNPGQRKEREAEEQLKEQLHYVKSLQPPHVHHVVAPLRHYAHDFYGFLRVGESRSKVMLFQGTWC